MGPPGAGKTHLAVSLALGAVSRGIGAYFVAAHDLVNDVRLLLSEWYWVADQ